MARENQGDNKKQGDQKNANLLDFRYLLETVVSAVKTHVSKVSPAPCDGLPLYLHYRWTVWALFGGFLAVFKSWYHKDNIVCVSHFNAEAQVREDYVNVCLSYPYLQEDGKRRYILFYRWVHWSFLLLAVIFYLPHKVSKNFGNVECKKLLEYLYKEGAEKKGDKEKEDEVVNKVYYYMVFNIRTHNGIYWKYLVVNTLALAVDFFAFVYLDFVLQGRFSQYGYRSFPFHRDPQNFSDYMSQTFPPFVSCELTINHQLVNRRTEMFGCHLTLMELYEKIFLGLWLWLIVLVSLTLCYIIFLLVLLLPAGRLLLLRFSKPVHATTKSAELIRNVLQHSRVGDVFILYRLRQYISHARLWDVMVNLENALANKRITDEECDNDANSSSPENEKPKTQEVKKSSKPYKAHTTIPVSEDVPFLRKSQSPESKNV